MARAEYRRFEQPDERRHFPNGHAEIVKIGGGEVGRYVFYPGWRWSHDVKPFVETATCATPHFQYHVHGHLAIRMDDGSEFVAGPGDVSAVPPGHDAWVVGDQPAVVIDWCGASLYAAEPPPEPPPAKKPPRRPAAPKKKAPRPRKKAKAKAKAKKKAKSKPKSRR